ncbi:MAG: hypothetical protein ACM3QZ_05680 [Solirubrobacterales bacterium]
MRKYYVTDFYNDILKDIGEGKYWFAVEEKVRKEYPNPDKILEFITAEHLPLGFDAANQVIFTRAALCDFAPLFPLFPNKDEGREMMGELIGFYANLHWREFQSELKKRGKKAIYKEFCIHAIKVAEDKGWERVHLSCVLEEFNFDRTEITYEGSLREIEEFIIEGAAFPYLINTYLDPAQRTTVLDDETIHIEPFVRTVPDTKGHVRLKRLR